jgi:hypothetical protein
MFGLLLLSEPDDNNAFATLSLVCNKIATFFHVFDLLLLVLFSYTCLDDDQIQHVKTFISDKKMTFL